MANDNHLYLLHRGVKEWNAARPDCPRLSHASLRGADLSGANLRHADLTFASVEHANLRGAGLSCADLYRARLDGADFTGAILKGAKLEDVFCPNFAGAIRHHGVTIARVLLARRESYWAFAYQATDGEVYFEYGCEQSKRTILEWRHELRGLCLLHEPANADIFERIIARLLDEARESALLPMGSTLRPR